MQVCSIVKRDIPGILTRNYMGIPVLTLGHLEKLLIERIRSQAGADAGMSLICCVPLELEFFEVPFI
jgi:hypothetical protein